MALSMFKPDGAEKRALSLLDAAAPDASLRDIFKGCDDETWLWALTEGRARDARLTDRLPELPPEDFQKQFTGRSGRLAFDQAIKGINGFLTQARALGLDTDARGLRVMDMGCGWGRLTQTLLRDFDPEQIVGGDVMPAAIQRCRDLGTPGELTVLEHFPPTSLGENSLDLIIAFSVFSHLAESAHLAWRDEIARVLRPGGVFVGTTRPRSFMVYVSKLREAAGPVPDHARGGAIAFMQSDDWLSRYERGEFCFDAPHLSPDWPGVYYGEAAVPRHYIETRWAECFAEVRFLDDHEHGLFDQAMFAVRK